MSLENPVVRRFATEDPLGFLRTYDGRVILDEVQRTPELFSYLQTIVDEDRQAGQYILSGSQNFLLSEALSQTLAGRVAVLRRRPLSYAELAGADLLVPTVAGAIHQGGVSGPFRSALSPKRFFPFPQGNLRTARRARKALSSIFTTRGWPVTCWASKAPLKWRATTSGELL